MKELLTKYTVQFWDHVFQFQLGRYFFIQIGWGFQKSVDLESKKEGSNK